MSEDDAHTFVSICFKRQVPLVVVLNPREHRDDRSASRRAAVLRELRRERGWKIPMLKEICPLSERSIWSILSVK